MFRCAYLDLNIPRLIIVGEDYNKKHIKSRRRRVFHLMTPVDGDVIEVEVRVLFL